MEKGKEREKVLKGALIELMKRSSMHIVQGVLIRRVYKSRVRGFFKWRGHVERMKELKEKRNVAVGTHDLFEVIRTEGGELIKKGSRRDASGMEREVQSIREIQQI